MSPIHEFEMKSTFVIGNLELVDIFFSLKVVGYETLDEIRVLDSVQLEFFNLYILFTKNKDRGGKIHTHTYMHKGRLLKERKCKMKTGIL